MSVSVRRRFKTKFSDGADDDDEQEEEDSDGTITTREEGEKNKQKPKNNKKRGLLTFGYKRGVRRVKRVVLFPFSKFQKLFTRNRRRRLSSLSHSHSSNSNLPITSTRVSGYFCCRCMSQPQTIDTTAVDSPPKKSDSNDPETSMEFCKALIEKNDFYSKECNTHFSD